MSANLKAIAARYASALRAAEAMAPDADGFVCPSVVDIWLWKLEEAVKPLVDHWGKNKSQPHWGEGGRGYDSFHLYGHRYCLKAGDEVSNAPDSVLFEAMGLDPSQEWGWLQFMVRDLGWHSMIAANWGHPVLKIPDGVELGTTTEEQRRAQAVAFYLELMRERGRDMLADVRALFDKIRARYRGIHGGDADEGALLDWAQRRNWALHTIYLYGGKPNPPHVLTKPTAPAYKGAQMVEFAAEIRRVAARRRANALAAWSCDCAEREAAARAEALAAEDAAGWEREREGIGHVLRGEKVMHRGDDIGVCPDGEIMPRLLRHLEEWTSAEYHIRNAYLQDRLAVFLARNENARDLLRLPDHQELAMKVKKEVRWLHIPV